MDSQKRRAYQFVQVDVFTDRIFGGNPLAVFLDGQGLSDEEMQSIAREMNLSETTFVLPPTHPDCAVRVRIFTPDFEMPFAGHPTIGTSYVLATRGMLPPRANEVNLEENIGPVAVTLDGDPAAPDFIWMEHRPASFKRAKVEPEEMARALGLSAADLHPDAPLEVGSTGVPFIYAPLRDKEAVDRAVPNAGLLGQCVEQAGATGVFILAPDPDPAAGRVYSRMFAAGTLGIPEDPATGAASGPLGVYLLRHGFVNDADHVAIVSEQGTKMGRQSFIHLRLRRDGGEAHRIEIGGTAVPVLEGTLFL